MKTETREHYGGDYGVTVLYTMDSESTAHCDFVAVEVAARGVPDNAPLYERKGATSSGDHVTDPHDAEPLVNGTVKWDGCSHVFFGEADNSGYIHLCGREAWDTLVDVLPRIYERCGQLMRAGGSEVLEGAFKN